MLVCLCNASSVFCLVNSVGVQQSHHALKQHTALLEAALGRRESTLAEMSVQFNDSNNERAGEEERLRSKFQTTEEALQGEKHASKQLRRQVSPG